MRIYYFRLPVFIWAILSLISCSTGIEKTKPITLSRNERRSLQPTEEETFMAGVSPMPLGQWKVGKPFLISDNKATLVFDADNAMAADSLGGMVIRFKEIASKTTPGGSDEAVVVFSDGHKDYSYSTGKSMRTALDNLSSMDIPMLIDLDLVKEASDLLVGKKVWTRSQLWYKPDGERIRGRKFVPVTIKAVSPGTMVFPLRLDILDERGEPAMLYMNIRSSGVESRTFENLFTLKDMKLRYPDILPEVWEYIQNGRLREGMTKEECKLSVGNPADVSAGHDWDSTLDIWKYSNGSYLQFRDGRLVGYRM